jgi:translation elongation factor EF-Tu-like GTPase
MIKIRAKIKLYEGGNKRKTPFLTGYRPLFQFIEEMKTSGQITLLNQEQFIPGQEGVVEILFLHKEYLGQNFRVGKTFTFYESEEPIGEGEVIEIISGNILNLVDSVIN